MLTTTSRPQQASVGSLLNCSAGSDDAFEAPAAPPPALCALAADDALADGGTIVGEWSLRATPVGVAGGVALTGPVAGADAAAAAVCRWVRAAPVPQWGALCPACLRSLDAGAGAAPAVALRGCQHMLHLHCLNDQLDRLRREGVSASPPSDPAASNRLDLPRCGRRRCTSSAWCAGARTGASRAPSRAASSPPAAWRGACSTRRCPASRPPRPSSSLTSQCFISGIK